MTDNLFDFLDDDACHVENVKSTAYPEGKTYVVPSPDAIVGARLTALADISRKTHAGVKVSDADMAKLHLDDEQERDFQEQILGPVLAEMRADGVSYVRMQRITQYVYMYFAMGEGVANKAAREGLLSGGKAFAPQLNRQQRRAQSKPGR